MEKVNLREKLALFEETWTPKIVGELNGQVVKLAKLEGEFVWHAHAQQDEMFLVIEGQLTIQMRDKNVQLGPGEFFIVPRGVEHNPICVGRVSLLLFEPASTAHTGDVEHERTVQHPEHI